MDLTITFLYYFNHKGNEIGTRVKMVWEHFLTDKPFPIFNRPIPRSKIERKSTEPVEEESSVLSQLLVEVLGWFFQAKGKHRDLLEQAGIAQSFMVDPPEGSHRVPLNIYTEKTYQWRNQPALIVSAGAIQSKKAGLGIALEHHKVSNSIGCLQKRSFAIYQISIAAESASRQTTNQLAKLLNEIFMQHLPEYYQSVIFGDASNSQIILPQEYKPSEILAKDFQHDSNVERSYRYTLGFDAEFESIRFIKGANRLTLREAPPDSEVTCIAHKDSHIGGMHLYHNLDEKVAMGSQVEITIKTNVAGIKMYSSNPEVFKIIQLSGPSGEGDGNRHYMGRALRSGNFTLTLQDPRRRFVKDSKHSVILATG